MVFKMSARSPFAFSSGGGAAKQRHMGACPWQLVAESAGFSAADYSPSFLLGGSFFGSQGLSPCNAYALRRAFALVRLKRNAWLCPCKQAKPSRPFRVTQKSSRVLPSSRACRGICPPVIPSLSRDMPSCHPELVEGSLCEFRQYLNRDPSKARVVLPCLQGVKRARRNRRHMGVCPWQLVAESVSFFCRRLLRFAPLRMTVSSRYAQDDRGVNARDF